MHASKPSINAGSIIMINGDFRVELNLNICCTPAGTGEGEWKAHSTALVEFGDSSNRRGEKSRLVSIHWNPQRICNQLYTS